ncbi:MAG: helix-turn-helix transcriptional regulator [Oscillospiraceae bacterium]|jgi:transcriptional regulator with XRE-family HTH domain|nr:helix-turn-helix transcriptional regulator [Oscillospiraceae bacterium]
MTFGERIKALRKERGMTQEELAERLSVTRQTVSKWEQGTTQPDLDRVLELGRLFGVSTDHLLGGGEPPRENRPSAPEAPGKSAFPARRWAVPAAGLAGFVFFCALLFTGRADETSSVVTINGYGLLALLCLGLALAALMAMIRRKK